MTDLENLLPAALDRLGSRAAHAPGLAADVRQAARRRRLLLVGPIAAVLAVCAVVGVVWATISGSAPRPVTGVDQSPTPAPTSACRPPQTGPLPTWARAGFSDDGAGVHWTLSASGDVAAILFAYPLVAPHAPEGRNNKILWVVKDTSGMVSTTDAVPAGPAPAGEGDRIVGHLEGSDVTAAADAGPGPSIVDMPQPGCWHLDLPSTWTGRGDSIDLEWVAGSGG